MNPVDILAEHYDPASDLYQMLVKHGQAVARKAKQAAETVPHLNPDQEFIEQAAMLHDIGIFLTNTPALGCYGADPYICHGHIGRNLLEQKGLPRHALVCERHVGTGIRAEDIRTHGLPLPEHDMMPVSIEEILVCYADKFFSKTWGQEHRQKRIEEILGGLKLHGQEQADTFLEWVGLFES